MARDEAARVGRTGADEAKHVAGTAAEQAGQVTREARRQAADLFEQARGQAAEQVRAGQHKATEGLRALAGELHGMADGGDRAGPASDLAEQAAERIDDVAVWLDRHEPGDLVEEVRAFARRRPGAFLVGAALAGVLAGRLTRGAVDASRADSPAPGGVDTPPVAGMPPAAPPPAAPVPAPGPAPTPAVPPPPPGGPYGAPPPVPPGGSFAPPPPPPGPGYPGPGYPPPGAAPRPAGPEGPGSWAPPPPPGGPVPPGPGAPPHALQSEASTVGEYVEELERGSTAPRAGDDPERRR